MARFTHVYKQLSISLQRICNFALHAAYRKRYGPDPIERFPGPFWEFRKRQITVTYVFNWKSNLIIYKLISVLKIISRFILYLFYDVVTHMKKVYGCSKMTQTLTVIKSLELAKVIIVSWRTETTLSGRSSP